MAHCGGAGGRPPSIVEGGDGRSSSSSLVVGILRVVRHRVASVRNHEQRIGHDSWFCCHVAVGNVAPRLCVIMKMGARDLFAYFFSVGSCGECHPLSLW